jgi:hypothetical protein
MTSSKEQDNRKKIEENVAHGMLTAEQVLKCVQGVYYEGYNDGNLHRGHGVEETDWQAIADELNAELRMRGDAE